MMRSPPERKPMASATTARLLPSSPMQKTLGRFLSLSGTHRDDHADVGRRGRRLRDARGAHRARAEVAAPATSGAEAAPTPIAAAAAAPEPAAPAPAPGSRLALLRRDDVVEGHAQACDGVCHLVKIQRIKEGRRRRERDGLSFAKKKSSRENSETVFTSSVKENLESNVRNRSVLYHPRSLSRLSTRRAAQESLRLPSVARLLKQNSGKPAPSEKH